MVLGLHPEPQSTMYDFRVTSAENCDQHLAAVEKQGNPCGVARTMPHFTVTTVH